MEVQSDFRDLLELLNKHHVEFILVGGYALAFHGAPRYTGDMDLFVHRSSKNAASIMAALNEFGFGGVGLTTDDFLKENTVIQLGVPPVRIDLVTSLTGVSWEDAYLSRESANYGDVPVSYIGRDQFITNKKATGRKRDLADLEALGEE
jgi:predicted nucleotidyltransferase